MLHNHGKVYESLTSHYQKLVAKTEKKKKKAAAAAARAAGAAPEEEEEEDSFVPHSMRLQHEEEEVEDVDLMMSA